LHAYVIPGAETLFAAETDAPVDAAGWATLQKAAQDVIKGAELLKSPSRSKGEGWNATADTVIKATKITADALAKKNADDLVFTDGDMMAGCTSCHQQFRDLKPPEGHLVEQKPN
jgi:cytochrome c556